jgi:preprotein translocase subunit SecE
VASEGSLPGRGRRRPDTRPAGEVQARPGRGGPFGGAGRFVQESWAELQKVEWPKQNQVVQGTVVVLVACVIVGVYLYLNDQLWKPVVQKLFLGQ